MNWLTKETLDICLKYENLTNYPRITTIVNKVLEDTRFESKALERLYILEYFYDSILPEIYKAMEEREDVLVQQNAKLMQEIDQLKQKEK